MGKICTSLTALAPLKGRHDFFWSIKQSSTTANSFYSLCNRPHPYSPCHITLQHQPHRYGGQTAEQLRSSPHFRQPHIPHKQKYQKMIILLMKQNIVNTSEDGESTTTTSRLHRDWVRQGSNPWTHTRKSVNLSGQHATSPVFSSGFKGSSLPLPLLPPDILSRHT